LVNLEDCKSGLSITDDELAVYKKAFIDGYMVERRLPNGDMIPYTNKEYFPTMSHFWNGAPAHYFTIKDKKITSNHNQDNTTQEVLSKLCSLLKITDNDSWTVIKKLLEAETTNSDIRDGLVLFHLKNIIDDVYWKYSAKINKIPLDKKEKCMRDLEEKIGDSDG